MKISMNANLMLLLTCFAFSVSACRTTKASDATPSATYRNIDGQEWFQIFHKLQNILPMGTYNGKDLENGDCSVTFKGGRNDEKVPFVVIDSVSGLGESVDQYAPNIGSFHLEPGATLIAYYFGVESLMMSISSDLDMVRHGKSKVFQTLGINKKNRITSVSVATTIQNAYGMHQPMNSTCLIR
jgi:hypothetical protein